MPETSWPEVWETAYNDLITPPQPPWSPYQLRGMSPAAIETMSALATRRPVEYRAVDMQRRDALRANLDRAGQQVEDIESEVQRLRRAREAIVRPKGLGWGLVILGYFTVSGVIVPVWVMSRSPQRLTPDLGVVTLVLFLSGLVALLGYMTVLALRLSGWRRKKA